MRYDKAFLGEEFHSALLTSYSFDPTVFENVLLVGMRSRGCRNIAVLADRDMVNQTLTELASAPRAGTAYHLAKRKVAASFHPKIALQLGRSSGVLMIGSANLTGAGLIGNLETISTIKVSEEDQTAAPLFAAALEYFERHADGADPAMREVISRARGRTPWLSDVEARSEVEIDGRRVSLLTEGEDASVGEQFIAFVGSDPIEKLVVVSPYADETLEALSQMRRALGNPPTSLVVDQREQDFTFDTFETQAGATLHSSAAHEWGDERPLHAKMVVACGQSNDYVLAGSANASMAGLYGRSGGPGNAEACIARTEPSGTALDRLGLSVCLSTEMAPEQMRLRRRGEAHAQASQGTPVDGGSFWLEHGFLFWSPPAGIRPADCTLKLVDGTGIQTIAPPPTLERSAWSVSLDPKASAPRQAVVIDPEGSESAPVPIASLSRLRSNSAPPQKGSAASILADLQDRDHIDPEDYDRAMKLLALAHADTSKKKDSRQRKRSEDTQGDEGETLSLEEFGRIEETPEGREALKSGPISEIRRLINAFVGLQHDVGDDDDELDPLSEHLGAKKKKRKGNGGGGQPGGALKHPIAEPKGQMSAAKERADNLVQHVNNTCEVLEAGSVDPLSLEASIRLHLLINIFLKSCAPVGEKPTPDYPISATDRAQSWIRPLGRLLRLLDPSIAKQVGGLRGREIEEECVEALTSILFCAGLVMDAARASKMPPAILVPLEAAHGGIARSVQQILSDKPVAEAYVRRNLPALAASHRLVVQRSSVPAA